MSHRRIAAGVTFERFESRHLLSGVPDPIVYEFGLQEVVARAASADARTGHMLLAGDTATVNDFAPGPPTYPVGPVNGSWSPFLARYAPDGQPAWVKAYDVANAYADGATFPVISAVAAGPDGSVYAAGTFSGSINFDVGQAGDPAGPSGRTLTTAASQDGQGAHGSDAFLVKYSSDGKFLWGTLINNVTTGTEAVTGLTVDRFGSAYVAGNFAPLAGGVAGPTRSFLAKFAPKGARSWRASLRGAVNTVAIDHHDAPWVAVGGDALRVYQFSARRGRFVSAIGAAAADNSTGHGIGSLTASSIAFDGHDNIVLSGTFSRTFDFAPGAARFLLGDKHYNREGLSNIFLSKLRPTGALVFAQTVGSIGADRSAGAGVDRRTGDIILSGTYSGAVDFDPAHRAATVLDAGYDSVDGDYPSDVFTARYSPTGRFVFVKDHTTLDADTAAGFAMTPTVAFMAASNYDQKHDNRHIVLFELPLA